mgnify:CR=1 FL=1
MTLEEMKKHEWSVSWSGGKDSTVLLDIVRKDYPDVKAVFVDTGLEYPEIRSFVNVDFPAPEAPINATVFPLGTMKSASLITGSSTPG